MPVQQGEWTAELARAHQRALAAPYDRVRPYVAKHGPGELLWSPADIEFSPTRLLQPDLFVIPSDSGGRASTWRDVKSLLLAVEALSPSTARADRIRKRASYQAERGPEYWIVDLEQYFAAVLV